MSPDSRGGWRDATALITQYILAGRETNEVLGEITSVVQALSGADYVTVSFADSEGRNVVEPAKNRQNVVKNPKWDVRYQKRPEYSHQQKCVFVM